MIPLTLSLTDFLSYRTMDAPLDLAGVHVACLSGANGNGKSALLDAITWALWGKARGSEGGQSQERLIRDGADEARVELTFELDGQTYRVARRRTRNGKGEVHLSVADGGRWTDLGAESVTMTQAAISKLLKMEYETFVASAYILQGRADEFSKMNAADRKDTLAKILGLEVYERLADRAKERKKEHAGRADALRADAERDEAQLQEIPVQQQALADAEAQAANAETERERAQTALSAAQQQLAHARAIEATAHQIEQRRADADNALAIAGSDIAALEREIAEAEATARAGDEHRGLAATRPALEEQERALEDARSRASELAEEIAELRTRIAVERKRLEGERDAAAKTAADARAEVDAVAGADELLAKAHDALRALDEAASERETLLDAHRGLEAERAREEAAVEGRATQRDELRDRARRLAGADAECPVCEQPLTPDHRTRIGAEVAAAIAALDDADSASRAAIKRIDKELATITRRGLELKRKLATRDDVQRQAAALQERITRAADAHTRLTDAEAQAAGIQDVITGDADSPTEREKLASMLAERESIGYDEAAHKTLRERLDAARAAERALQGAEHAAARVRTLSAQATAARRRFDAAKDAVASAARDLAEARRQLGDMAAIEAAVTAAQTILGAAQHAVVEHRSAAAQARERLATLAQVAERAQRSRAEHADARALAQRYEKLAKTFGRDGIPARIIGNAIPELRQEANRLLGVLTDGRLSVELELQRETRSRSVKETLDITVWHNGSKRAYEMYSGGERLRIDFALRIALSRLLARRANTRLETLVIDEGFGSQDAEGRSRLVEAILKVKADFRRILVITHIEELKERFPVRLEVVKDAVGGSRVEVV